MSTASNDPGTRMTARHQAGAFLALLLLSGTLGWMHLTHLDPDSVAYIRLARHWAGGDFALAVAGYWGPLLSWLIAAGMKAGLGDLVAARVAMTFSALGFLAGASAFYLRAGLTDRERALALWLTALAAAPWSRYIFPDLLMAGFILAGCARLMHDEWTTSPRRAFIAGMVLALGYLSKPVGFPSGIMVILVIAAMTTISGAAPRKAAVRAAALTLLGFAVVALPWASVLSARFGRPMFSTSSEIGHAIAGPPAPGIDRYHPTFTTFHAPEPGRMTSWEDPSSLKYHDWSAFDSAASFKWQIQLGWENLGFILRVFSSFEFLYLGLFAVICGFALHAPWREGMRTGRWRWSLPLMAGLFGLYLPFNAGALRYYWMGLPFLIACTLRMVAGFAPESHAVRRTALLLVAASFAVPPLTDLHKSVDPASWHRRSTARDLAELIRAKGVAGPVAGNWAPETAFYVAHYLDQPYMGYEPRSGVDRWKGSGATLIILDRATLGLARLFAKDPAFEDLGPLLYGSEDAAAARPLKVYRVHPPADT